MNKNGYRITSPGNGYSLCDLCPDGGGILTFTAVGANPKAHTVTHFCEECLERLTHAYAAMQEGSHEVNVFPDEGRGSVGYDPDEVIG